MKQLDGLNTRLEELKAKREKLCREIQELEETRIDAEVVRANLQNFDRVFQALTPKERRELMQLMVAEVIYDKQNGVIRLSLRPLPLLNWGVSQEGLVLIPVKNGVGKGI